MLLSRAPSRRRTGGFTISSTANAARRFRWLRRRCGFHGQLVIVHRLRKPPHGLPEHVSSAPNWGKLKSLHAVLSSLKCNVKSPFKVWLMGRQAAGKRWVFATIPRAAGGVLGRPKIPVAAGVHSWQSSRRAAGGNFGVQCALRWPVSLESFVLMRGEGGRAAPDAPCVPTWLVQQLPIPVPHGIELFVRHR